MKLVLGVVDIPYAQRPPVQRIAKPVKGRRRPLKKPVKVASGHQTTGDVAMWLENRYGVMAYFASKHMDVIVGSLEDAMKGTIESLLMGAPPRSDPFASGLAKIQQEFRAFLDSGEMKGAGIPTMAAMMGVNHRLKHPYARANPARPSFIDTGLFQSSFKAWIDR